MMAKLIDIPFNPKPPTILHIDLNSCFAMIEQQANPLLRGRPIAVAAYTSPAGCIVAPSIEAKTYGIKTGMRVKDGKMLFPDLIILPPEPDKYRVVHLKIRNLLSDYTDDLQPKSIDEFYLNLEGYPAYKKGMLNVGREIKQRIKEEVGDWLTVSIGIGANRFLAKTAASLHKPDGLDEITKDNFLSIYSSLPLRDLHGIDSGYSIRLNNAGIFTTHDLYSASEQELRHAFKSINGYYWYLRLRGWEIDDVDFGRKSFGNSFAIGKSVSSIEELSPILHKLVEKTGHRMRKAGYKTRGIHVAVLYRDGTYWHQGVTLPEPVYDSADIYRHAFKILSHSPYRLPVHTIAESCFELIRSEKMQLGLFENELKKENRVKAVDKINERWGSFVITPAHLMGTNQSVVDRVAFGGVKELEEYILNSAI